MDQNMISFKIRTGHGTTESSEMDGRKINDSSLSFNEIRIQYPTKDHIELTSGYYHFDSQTFTLIYMYTLQ